MSSRCGASHAGWQLGSDPEIQIATNVSNHLTAGIMKYFGDSGRFGPAVNLFEKLVVRDGEMASLLAKAYLGMGEPVGHGQVNRSIVADRPATLSARRGGQGGAGPVQSHPGAPPVVPPSPCSVRLPPE